jgi:hypothetical protein
MAKISMRVRATFVVIIAAGSLALGGALYADAKSSEGKMVGDSSGNRTARVAGGQTVTLANSSLSQKELAALRPQMSELIPKKR